jgi:AcrR family transcriptional regulator
MEAERGPRARMQKVMRDTAMRLMQGGQVPSVSEVAEAAEVSRATAYRYFPSQASIIQAAVNEALGPVLDWSSDSEDAGERITDLFASAYPGMLAHEALHRAALRLALEQWARRFAGTMGDEARIVRGNRKGLLASASAPLKGVLGRQTYDNLMQSLSLIFGVEAIIVLKDLWGLDDKQVERVASWAAHALVAAAVAESKGSGRGKRPGGASAAGARTRKTRSRRAETKN